MTTRTTVTLADDVAAEVDRIRRQHGVGVSEAVNDLARRGMSAQSPAPPRVEVPSFPLGIMIDISNVAEAIDLLDQLEAGDGSQVGGQ
jgi:hypothetical protein